MKKKYDVIVVGGGTAGCSCAWNAAKHGLNTLIVEQNSFLGGSITSSLVIPAMKTSKNAINNDFYNKLYEELTAINGAITYIDDNPGWFNPVLTKIALDKIMKEVNVDIIFEANVTNIKTDLNKILSVNIDTIYNNNLQFFNSELSSDIETVYFVDATGDAKIFEKLNCKFLKNSENDFQPVNLRFILSGVNTKKFTEWIMEFDKDRKVTTSCKIGDNYYVSTAYTWDNKNWALKPIFTRAIDNGDITIEDSNYFQLFSVAGTYDSIAFNAPRILDVNISRSEVYIKGRESIFRLFNFCKKYLCGFENSYISSIADTLGIRVSNRISGKYIYTYEDLISGKTFDNPVLQSNYPVDIHSSQKDNSILQQTNIDYQLPVESLMSIDYENLFAVGRCISADFKAQAAIRIIPSCFSMGEGLAKYLANTK